MKKNMTTTLALTIVVLTMNSCARYYGATRPIIIPEKKELATIEKIDEEQQALNTTKLNSTEKTVTIKTMLEPTTYQMATAKPTTEAPEFIIDKTNEQITDSKSTTIFKTVSAAAETGSKMDGFAVAGFVMSLVGVFIAAYILGTLGIIFSAIAMVRINKSAGSKRGRGLAIAGLILGIVGILVTTILLLAFL